MNIVSLSFGQYPVRQPNSQYHLIDYLFSLELTVTEIPLRSKAHNKPEQPYNATLSIMHYYRRKSNVCSATPSGIPIILFCLKYQEKRSFPQKENKVLKSPESGIDTVKNGIPSYYLNATLGGMFIKILHLRSSFRLFTDRKRAV